MKNALITGITGQDGSYLAELLLEKGYKVYGIMRRKSVVDYGNVDHIKEKIHFIYADMTDLVSLVKAMQISQADEVYNLAAQSFVATSWDTPIGTAEIDALGVTNMLEAIRMVKPEARFYQASTSEMFGKVQEIPQTEKHHFIQEVHMELQSYMDIGLQKIIEKVLACMLVQEFCLIMNRKDVEKSLLQEKLHIL